MIDARCALMTPSGPAALATLLVRGDEAPLAVRQLFLGKALSKEKTFEPGSVRYGLFGDQWRDDVVLAFDNFDGVPEFEIHCHGGVAMVESLLRDLVAAGCQRVDWRDLLVERGESMSVIEARRALSNAPTWRSARLLLDQLDGRFDLALDEIRANRDRDRCQRMIDLAPAGLHLVEPFRILFLGPTNVGKSRLVNALVGHERAIVSNREGTTRDLLTTRSAWDGWPIEFWDGAGFRETDDEIERAGQQMLRKRRREADLGALVIDLSRRQPDLENRLRVELEPAIVVGNKSDLVEWNDGVADPAPDVWVSSLSGAGLEELMSMIMHRLVPFQPDAGEPLPINRRQIELLRALRESL